jgi:capsular polysaccharide export protein
LSPRYKHSAFVESFNEALFRFISFFAPQWFPFYRSDKYYNPLREYWSGIRREFRLGKLGRQADGVVAELISSKIPFYLVALQTQGDYQLRDNSAYPDIGLMIREVVSSFAADAPADNRLVFKLHPHDNGIEKWERVVARIAGEKGVADRVTTIDGGDLDRLLASARGAIMINSTVGLFAIRASCPVKVLGIAIYDIAGLTHQGPLRTFWTEPEPVDRGLASDFVRALAGTTQVKGSFYEPAGRKAAIDEIVSRIENGRVNEPGAYEQRPPRLERARKLGIAITFAGNDADQSAGFVVGSDESSVRSRQ